MKSRGRCVLFFSAVCAGLCCLVMVDVEFHSVLNVFIAQARLGTSVGQGRKMDRQAGRQADGQGAIEVAGGRTGELAWSLFDVLFCLPH